MHDTYFGTVLSISANPLQNKFDDCLFYPNRQSEKTITSIYSRFNNIVSYILTSTLLGLDRNLWREFCGVVSFFKVGLSEPLGGLL